MSGHVVAGAGALRPSARVLAADRGRREAGVDRDAASPFRGAEVVQVLSQREGARGYRVTLEGEEPLDTRRL